jgi:fibronectin-binding autotransporter adhesin
MTAIELYGRRAVGVVFGLVFALTAAHVDAALVAQYDSGIAASIGLSGAADPTAGSGVAAWTANGSVSSYSDGYDSGNGGWTVVDGTGGSGYYYQHNLSGADISQMAYGWTATFIVGVNADAVPAAGGGVDNYYTAVPSRQNDNVMWIENNGNYLYILTFKNDASGNVIIGDGTTDSNVSAVVCQQFGGSDTMDYITFTLTYDAGTGVATLSDDKGSTPFAVATSGPATTDRVLFGATSAGGQGSTTWNSLEVTATDDAVKADNTDNLNLGSSWVPGLAPGTSQVGVWDSTVTGANSVSLGANLSWLGLRIEDPGGDVTISGANSLTLGSGGLDLGATRNLTYDSTSALTNAGTFQGSTTFTYDNNSTKIWTASAFDFTGDVVLRGGSAAAGSFANNWWALSNIALTQSGSFGLDTGAALTDRGEFILTDAWGNGVGRPKLSLSSLSGFGDFRSDWGGTSAVNQPRTISVDQSTTTTYSGRIIENNTTTRQIGLEKLGAGTLILNPGGGASGNAFTGGTTIEDGTVEMERADALGSGTSGNTDVTLRDGTLDLSFDGTGGAYAAATTHYTALFNTLTLGGVAGATPTVLTSGTVGSGAALGIVNSIVYDAANDPGAATIPGRFITVGTSFISSREIAVGDSAATTTELQISGQMGRVGTGDGQSTTIRKTGAGTLKISGQNNFPVLQIEGGKVVAAHAQALGVSKVLANSLIMTNGTIEAGDADRSYSTPVTLADSSVNTVTGDTQKLTLTGVVSGGGSLQKTGDAELSLTAANTYSGGTSIDAGTLSLSGSGLPGSGSVTINDPGLLYVDAGATKVFNMALSGDGSLTKEGGFQLQLLGPSLGISGTIRPNNGLIIIDPTGGNMTGEPDVFFSSTDAGDGIVFGEQFNGKTIPLGNLDGSGSENAKLRCDFGANGFRTLSVNQTVDGAFTGVIEQSNASRDFALVKTGAAKLTLSGDNTFGQGTTISNGTLQIERADSLGNADGTRNVTLRDGTLDLSFDGTGGAYASATTHYTALFNTLTLGGVAGATPTVLTSGTVGSGAALGIANSIVYDAANDPGAATIPGRFITVGTSGISSREIAVGDSAATTTELEISGQMGRVGTGDGQSTTIRKTGAGSLTISGQNNFPGLQVEGGTLVVNNAQALGVAKVLAHLVTVSNGMVNVNGFSPSIGGLSDGGGTTGTILNDGGGAATLTAGSSGATTTFSGSIADGSQPLALTKIGAGTLTLNGANTYSDTTTVNGGTLRIGNGATTGTLGSGPVVLTSGELRFYRSDDVTASTNVISGAGNLAKQGAGKATLTGNNTYTGTTSVEGGTLEIGNGGSSGDIGSGAVTVNAGSTLAINRTGTLDYKATAKMRNVSGAGDIELDGGVFFFNYTGAGGGFAEAGSWSGFSGDLRVLGGSEFQTIRNGATAMGTGTIELGDGSSSGYLSQIEGNWTWTNPVDVTGSANEIRNRATGSGRVLKLQGIINGSGGLTLTDTAGSMTDAEFGFILTGANTLSGSLTVDGPVRVGGVAGDSSSTSADAAGSLGTASVTINAGETLTFSRTDDHTNSATLGGSGNVRVGLNSGTGSQVVTLEAGSTYSGTTTVDAGTLTVGTGGTLGTGATTLNANNTSLRFDRGASDYQQIANVLLVAASVSGSTMEFDSGTNVLTGTSTTSPTAPTINIAAGATLQLGEKDAGPPASASGSLVNGIGGAMTIASGGTFRLNHSGGGGYTATGTLQGGGLFQSDNSGNLGVGGDFTAFTGTFRINNGGVTYFYNTANAKFPNAALELNGGGINLSDQFNDSSNPFETGSLSGTSASAFVNGAFGGGATRLWIVNQSVAGTYQGYIEDSGGRLLALRKSGPATLTMTGASTYSGGTTVSNGTLLVNNVSGSGTGTGTLAVQDGATLGGTGSVGGLATLESGSTLAPGVSPGTLTFTAGMNLDAGSALTMEMGTSSDLISVTGGTLTGPPSGIVTITVSNSGGLTDIDYTLIDWTGASASDVDVSDFDLVILDPVFRAGLFIQGSQLILSVKPTTSVFTFR